MENNVNGNSNNVNGNSNKNNQNLNQNEFDFENNIDINDEQKSSSLYNYISNDNNKIQKVDKDSITQQKNNSNNASNKKTGNQNNNSFIQNNINRDNNSPSQISSKSYMDELMDEMRRSIRNEIRRQQDIKDEEERYKKNRNSYENETKSITNSDGIETIYKGASTQSKFLEQVVLNKKQIEIQLEDISRKFNTSLNDALKKYGESKKKDSDSIDKKKDKVNEKHDNKINDIVKKFKNPDADIVGNCENLVHALFDCVNDDFKASTNGYLAIYSMINKFNKELKKQLEEDNLEPEVAYERKVLTSKIGTLLDECEFFDVNKLKMEIKKRIQDIEKNMALNIFQTIKAASFDFIFGENYHESGRILIKCLNDIFNELSNLNDLSNEDKGQQSIIKIIHLYGKYEQTLAKMPLWFLYPKLQTKKDKNGKLYKEDILKDFVSSLQNEKYDLSFIFSQLFKIFGADIFYEGAIKDEHDKTKVRSFLKILYNKLPAYRQLSNDQKRKIAIKLSLLLPPEDNDMKIKKISKQLGMKEIYKDSKKNLNNINYKIVKHLCEGDVKSLIAQNSKKKLDKKISFEEALFVGNKLSVINDDFDKKCDRVDALIGVLSDLIQKDIDSCNNCLSKLSTQELYCNDADVYYTETKTRIMNKIENIKGILIGVIDKEFASDSGDARSAMEYAKKRIEDEIKVYSKDGKAKGGDEYKFSQLNGFDFRDISKEIDETREKYTKQVDELIGFLKKSLNRITPSNPKPNRLYNELKDMSVENRRGYENIKIKQYENEHIKDMNNNLIDILKSQKENKNPFSAMMDK